jgi:hypothetical protein
MGLVKIVLSLLANLLGFMKDRQLIEAGKAEAKNEQSEATLDAVTAVRAPISDDERERLWRENAGKYGMRDDSKP